MSQIESDGPPLIMASRSVSFHAASHGPSSPELLWISRLLSLTPQAHSASLSSTKPIPHA